MQIRLNGKLLEIDDSPTLAELLERYEISLSTSRVAVALNECLALRAQWNLCVIKEGDRIEIIHAVQGG